VIGRVAPESGWPVKPVPVRDPVLMISGAVPDEVIVSGSVAVEFKATFPKFSAIALTVSRGPVLAVLEPPTETVAGPDGVALIA